jgi:hypothetical protein
MSDVPPEPLPPLGTPGAGALGSGVGAGVAAQPATSRRVVARTAADVTGALTPALPLDAILRR